MNEGISAETMLSPSPRSHRRARWYAWIVGGCVGLCVLIVIGCALLGGAVTGLIYTFTNQKEATATGSQTLAVSGTSTLDVTNVAGSITVERGNAGEVKIVYHKRAHDVSQGDAQRALNAMIVTISQADNTISVSVRSPNTASMEAFGSQHTVDIILAVPPTANLRLRLTAGSVRVSDITGTLTSTVQAGNVDLNGLALSGSNSIRVGTGNVTFDGSLLDGSALDVRVATGNTHMIFPSNSAIHMTADTSVGDVTISGWPITPTHAGAGATAAGNTAVKPTSTLNIHADTGRISVLATG